MTLVRLLPMIDEASPSCSKICSTANHQKLKPTSNMFVLNKYSSGLLGDGCNSTTQTKSYTEYWHFNTTGSAFCSWLLFHRKGILLHVRFSHSHGVHLTSLQSDNTAFHWSTLEFIVYITIYRKPYQIYCFARNCINQIKQFH